MSSAIEAMSTKMDDSQHRIRSYKRIVLLTEGFSESYFAKAAMSPLRYRRGDVVAILDATEAGKTANALFGVGNTVPVVSSLNDLGADAVFLGTAVAGGKLPEAWMGVIADALSRGIDVVSGMHDFLNDVSEFKLAAEQHNCQLVDVRRNHEHTTATGKPFRDGCLQIHTVGQDCRLKKMVVGLEIQHELVRRHKDAAFVATGQTGIMISGTGVPVGWVVADFVNGSVEALIRRNEHHDVLLIEGHGDGVEPFGSVSAATQERLNHERNTA